MSSTRLFGSKERYRRRFVARHSELSFSWDYFLLTGHTQDKYNSNRTPARGGVRVRPVGGVRRGNGLEEEKWLIEGMVMTGHGSINNNPTNGIWKGPYSGSS